MLTRFFNEIVLIVTFLFRKLSSKTINYFNRFEKTCDTIALYIKYTIAVSMCIGLIVTAVYCFGRIIVNSIKTAMDKPQYSGVILDMRCDISGNNCDLLIEDENGKQIKAHTSNGYMYKRLYENRETISLIDFK